MDEKKSILIVDDDESIRRSLTLVFAKKGYDTETARTGREAIEKTQRRFFNLALLDIRLPDMQGTELLTEMHRDKPRMMKIMVTGYPSLENAVEAVNKGADAYVMKPAEPERLLRLVEERLEEQQEAEKMSEEKVAEWIRSRARKLEQKKPRPSP
ncbi:MAG: response regulator [Candidatus Geothermarchaeales archaeon]